MVSSNNAFPRLEHFKNKLIESFPYNIGNLIWAAPKPNKIINFYVSWVLQFLYFFVFLNTVNSVKHLPLTENSFNPLKVSGYR